MRHVTLKCNMTFFSSLLLWHHSRTSSAHFTPVTSAVKLTSLNTSASCTELYGLCLAVGLDSKVWLRGVTQELASPKWKEKDLIKINRQGRERVVCCRATRRTTSLCLFIILSTLCSEFLFLDFFYL